MSSDDSFGHLTKFYLSWRLRI